MYRAFVDSRASTRAARLLLPSKQEADLTIKVAAELWQACSPGCFTQRDEVAPPHGILPQGSGARRPTTPAALGTGISAISGGQLISYGNNKNNNNIGPEGAPTSFYSQM